MYKSKWSTDFGLYKYEEFKKESATTKFIVTATVVGIVLFGGFYLTIFLLRHSFEAPLDLVSSDNKTTSKEDFSTNSTISSDLDYQNSTPLAEKLMGDPNPLPFHNNFRGPPPTSFIPLSNQHYPQLQNYARPGYPRNIQEIISYIHPEPQKPKRINFNHDPFHSYKPKDPSDINLLATANLRFAPPIWKDLNTNPLVPAQSSYKPRYEGKKPRKPIELTLNVFPMPNDGSRSNYFGFAGGQGGRVKFEGSRGMRARKMVIHLNFYSEEEEEEIEKRFLEGNYESLEDILSPQEDGN